MNTEQLLIQALLQIEGCMNTCEYAYFEDGYPECSKGWCDNHCEYKLNIGKLIKEFDLKE
jgi:hypothetical protein